jgi:hypothetical protein
MSEVVQRTQETAREIAEGLRLECFFPSNHELILDIDGPKSSINIRVLEVLTENGVVYWDNILQVRSKSGEGVHAYICFAQKITPETRLLLQACLGSDPVREILSAVRLTTPGNDVDSITASFETEKATKDILVWRQKSERWLASTSRAHPKHYL